MSSENYVILKNSLVILEYNIKDKDGNILDTSRDRELIHYRMGSGGFFEKIENAMLGHKKDDFISVDLAPEEAFGVRDENLVTKVPRTNFGTIVDFQRGMQLAVQTPTGATTVTVLDYDNSEITVDANHPLAGRNLIFEIFIVGVESE